MGYDRYSQGNQGDGNRRDERQEYGRDYGSGRDYTYSSARDYQAAGGRDRDDRYGGDRYGRTRDEGDRYGARSYGSDRGNSSRYGGDEPYHGSYASDGRRFEDVGQRRDWNDDNRYDPDRGYGRSNDRYGRGGEQQGRYGREAYGRTDGDRGQRPGYGRQPQGYDYDERGFLARAGDEVRSWFGDEEAERRRDADSRYDERYYREQGHADRDSDYGSWRAGQIAALDRDYDEYRRENRSKFENEFSTWRTGRQTQRDSLGKVGEHDEVLGSDGSHVGTVDKVRGDRILLTKNDRDAGGQHHSIPSSWIISVEDKKVTLNKTADEAKRQWRDEENKQAMFGYGDKTAEASRSSRGQGEGGKGTDLNSSFSGTY